LMFAQGSAQYNVSSEVLILNNESHEYEKVIDLNMEIRGKSTMKALYYEWVFKRWGLRLLAGQIETDLPAGRDGVYRLEADGSGNIYYLAFRF